MSGSVKHITMLLLSIYLIVSITSCKRVETEPRDWIREDLVWDEKDLNATVAGFFLNSVYSYIPSGFNRIGGDYLDAASGDAIPSRNNQTVEYYTNGQISVLNNPDPYWASSYAGVRAANIFLSNIDRVPMAAQTKRYWKAEARYVRALMYFELLKRYGGIPLVGNKVLTVDDKLELPRNSYADCVNYIVNECDAIKDSLRLETGANYTTSDWGRIAKGAAIALKCRTYLYAASPLFNGGAVEGDLAKKILTSYPAYDVNRWQLVVNAAQELIGLNYYALNSSFGNVFTVNKNTEVILSKQGATNFSVETNNAPVGFSNPVSFGRTSPTAQFVNAFPMNNGLAITAAGSGYNAQSPYTNRDPRLALTVFYNGYKWLNRNIQTYDGGLDKPGGSVVQTKTGYYLRKFMADFSSNTAYSNQYHNFVLFRYAEVILNYAEALNELGRTEDAVAQLILIRKRAGILAGTNNRYGVPSGISQTDFRVLLQNERRIELAFEEHRFWDIRRWKTAPDVLNGSLSGTKITLNGTVLNFQDVNVATVSFSNKLYHMPLPYDEVIKNNQLIQNEGW
ncbi:Starch-binding associating with outer membrane [Pedobacter rhizosphaerae]|uniref:Starch-binding associating with outer membrane n=1 Tax=Pedobacter rhizosphaerae TaxID=390241 RepID=A0A1H9MLT7_9SPHI|nr:Starch-binding associating with outer membrane [Pedobacter rhizosphaerae]